MHSIHNSQRDWVQTLVQTALRLIVFTISVGCLSGFSFAQTDSDRKRFSHEKHGAIVFAKGDDYELKCDIYQPESDEPRPVMLAIHGGAWTTGTKFAMLRHARILANRGYVVMALNYRLAPDHKWPAQIHDCKHAVRWIREHASRYNADPKRVYAFGYSAGGHLASMLATTDKDDGLEGNVEAPYSEHSSRVQGLIAGGAPTEFSWVGEQETTLEYWLGATRAADPKVYANASPTTFVTSDDPPMVLYHGKTDALVPYLSPTRFVDRCNECDVDAELLLLNGGHAAAFTLTTSLIDSLEKLEAKLAKRNCRQKIASLVQLAIAFEKANGHAPKSIGNLRTFVVESKSLDSKAVGELTTNKRDGQPFEIHRNSNGEVIVCEAIGVNGVKLSSEDK